MRSTQRLIALLSAAVAACSSSSGAIPAGNLPLPLTAYEGSASAAGCPLPSRQWVATLATRYGVTHPVDPPLNSLASDPRTATVYAANGDSLLRSSDCGVHWQTSLAKPVGTVLVSASDPSTVYAAGGADGGLLSNYPESSSPPSLFRSDDGGRTWTRLRGQVTSPGPKGQVGGPGLAVDPHDPNHLIGVLYCTDQETVGPFCVLLTSQDGGRSWQRPPEAGALVPLAFDPSHSGTAYGTWLGSGGLGKSDNGGRTWHGAGPRSSWVFGVVVPTSDVLYAYGGRVFETTDGGRSWRNTTPGTDLPQYPGATSWRVGAIAVCPSEPATVYAGTADGVRVTNDGGRHWRPFWPPLPASTRVIAITVADHGTVLVARITSGDGSEVASIRLPTTCAG
jgi:photosystem II stability/assembly factor-like uncharacterized protein